MSLYEALGVAKNATADAIKRAYRKKAHKAHPDKGGSEEAFHPIQKAYEVLSDPQRRAQYDQNGSTDQQDNSTQMLSQIAALMLQILDKEDADYTDVMAIMRKTIGGAKAQAHNAILEMNAKVAKRRKAAKRFSKKKGGPNVMVMLIEGEISKHLQMVESANAEIVRLNQMLEALEDYEYQFDQRPQQQEWPAFMHFNVR